MVSASSFSSGTTASGTTTAGTTTAGLSAWNFRKIAGESLSVTTKVFLTGEASGGDDMGDFGLALAFGGAFFFLPLFLGGCFLGIDAASAAVSTLGEDMAPLASPPPIKNNR
jgi:hypothetical protein